MTALLRIPRALAWGIPAMWSMLRKPHGQRAQLREAWFIAQCGMAGIVHRGRPGWLYPRRLRRRLRP